MGINNLLKLYMALKERAQGGGLVGLNYKEAAIMTYVEEQIYNQITSQIACTATEINEQAIQHNKQYTPGIKGRAI